MPLFRATRLAASGGQEEFLFSADDLDTAQRDAGVLSTVEALSDAEIDKMNKQAVKATADAEAAAEKARLAASIKPEEGDA
jgi:hypothetical protein